MKRKASASKKVTSKKATSSKVGKKTSRKSGKQVSKQVLVPSVKTSLRVIRFAGVVLGGGKTDKTAVAVLEYFPDQKRVFLRSLRDKISSKGEVSADEALIEVLTKEEIPLSVIAFDAPLQMPKCLRCTLKCPGVKDCHEPEIKWMRQVHSTRSRHKRPNKMFTPYTERAAEIHIAHSLEEPFHPSQALGANAAPLTARASFLLRQLKTPVMEVYPKLSLWRIGRALDMPKSYLRFHKHAVDSDEARHFILKTLIEKEIAFVYQQDLRTMVEQSPAFDAFMCALTAFLKHQGQTEPRPMGFPKDEIWIDYPLESISWF